jgi:hypothetical protein
VLEERQCMGLFQTETISRGGAGVPALDRAILLVCERRTH